MDKQHILVVDDEPNIVQLARLYLERDGYTITSVDNGQKALEAIRTQEPDLVVLGC